MFLFFILLFLLAVLLHLLFLFLFLFLLLLLLLLAVWFRTAMNLDESTGTLAHPLACTLTPLKHSLSPHLLTYRALILGSCTRMFYEQTDTQTNGRMDRPTISDARTHLKKCKLFSKLFL